ncbi:taste receptor type 2 member 14 [Erinaceus europaeus]|uniref:Taste receptor type 2 n=1 Tax=Erinaceus europaeus TaxID=9365 RepID=A0A1S2Z9C5_ERIEU|nr:taste receptor type 2 member 14 [Erinaceus europaeus]
MASVVNSTFLVIISAEIILGSLGNGFIVLVNCINWIQKRKVSSLDQILTGLALSRIGLFWVVLINSFMLEFGPSLFVIEKVLEAVVFTWAVTNHFSIWFATSLSIFYFLKISNFTNSVFLYLKWRVKKVVMMVLLLTLVFLIFNVALMKMYINYWSNRLKSNMTHNSRMRNFVKFSNLFVFTNAMFTCLPFAVSLIIFLLLILSLWKHLKKVQQSAKESRDTSSKAHIKALQTIITFLLLYAIFFLSLLVSAWSSDWVEKIQITLLCQAIGNLYPLGHSCVLILVNSKLKQTFLSVLRVRFSDGAHAGP